MDKDRSAQQIDFLWFFPTNGDVRFFGHADGARKVDNRYLREMAIALDRLGYFGALLPTGNFCEDSLVVASSLATHTERMRFLIALRPGSVVPAEAARQSASLDRLTKGRLLLNVVSGGVAGDMEADGNFLSHDERYIQSAEFLDIWRRMMQGEAVTSTGKHYSCKNAQLMYPSVQRPYPPLYIGGASPAGRDLAVNQCDVYLTWGEPPAMVAETIADVRRRAAAVGRQMRFGIRLHFIVRDTDEEAWRAAERLIEKVPDHVIEAAQKKLRQADAEGQKRLLALHGGDKKRLEISPNLWAGVGLVRAGAATTLVGSPQTVAERIKEYMSLGIDSIIGSGYPHMEESYRVAEMLFPLLPIRTPSSVAENELPESFATAGTIGLRLPDQAPAPTAKAS